MVDIQQPGDINIGFVDQPTEDKYRYLILGLDNVGDDGQAVNIGVGGSNIVTVIAAEDSDNTVNLKNLDAGWMSLEGAGNINVTGLADNSAVSASELTGNFSLNFNEDDETYRSIDCGSSVIDLNVRNIADEYSILSLVAPNAESVTFNDDGYNLLHINAPAADVAGAFGSAEHSSGIDIQAQTASIEGDSGSNRFTIQVGGSAVLNGNGGGDQFVVGSLNPGLGQQAEMVRIEINGTTGEYDDFSIGTNYVENGMVVEINGYDQYDFLSVMPGYNSSFMADAFVGQDAAQAEESMSRFFGDANTAGLASIVRNGDVVGFYNEQTGTVYAFAANMLQQVVAGVQINNVDTFEIATDALLNAWQWPDSFASGEQIVLETGRLDYSVATYPNGSPTPTRFDATAGNGYESTLVSGVKILGDPRVMSSLHVAVYGDFHGLGSDGFVSDVQDISLFIITDATPVFNAENMGAFHYVSISNAPVTITNLTVEEQMSIYLSDIQQENAAINIGFASDSGATPQDLTISIRNVGSAESSIRLIADGVNNLSLASYGDSDSWLDISDVTGVRNIEFRSPIDPIMMDISSDEFHLVTGMGQADLTVAAGNILDFDSMYFGGNSVLNIEANGQIGTGPDGFVQIGGYNLSEINITALDDVFVGIYSTANVNLEVSQAATIVSEGFWWWGGTKRFDIAASGVNDAEIIEANIIGVASSPENSESFSINTASIDTAMHVTIGGFDYSDTLEIDAGTGLSAGVANIDADSGAAQMLKYFGISSTDSLESLGANDAIYGYYDGESETAYAFAADASGEINTGVQLNGVSFDLACQAFGIDMPQA